MKFLSFDETRDFPYYNHNPRLSKLQWFILLILVPIALFGQFLFGSEFLGSIFFCFLILIPLLYFSNWDYKLLFHKPTKNEIILALLMFIGYMTYAIIAGVVLDSFHLSSAASITDSITVTPEIIISLIFSMMGEELLKFIPLMFFMRLVYKYTDNRKLSIIISFVLVLLGFGLLHYAPPFNTIASVLVLQGVGTIFELYGYLRTKNLLVPYITHLLTDAVIFILIFIGIS